MTSRLMSAASEPAASAPSPEGSCGVETFGAVSMIRQVKGGISDATPAMISSTIAPPASVASAGISPAPSQAQSGPSTTSSSPSSAISGASSERLAITTSMQGSPSWKKPRNASSARSRGAALNGSANGREIAHDIAPPSTSAGTRSRRPAAGGSGGGEPGTHPHRVAQDQPREHHGEKRTDAHDDERIGRRGEGKREHERREHHAPQRPRQKTGPAGAAHCAPGIPFHHEEKRRCDERAGEEAAPEHLLERRRALDVPRDHARGAPKHGRRDHQREGDAAARGFQVAFLDSRNPASAAAVWPGAAPAFSGGPWNTILPPPSPPSGPRSMIQSASAMTSRLCSITTTVLPASTRRCSTWISFSTSAMCRPTVGSSRT